MALANGKYKGAQLSLTINSIEYKMDLMRAEILAEDAESDATTFADMSVGGSFDWFLDVEYVSDYATGSLWTYIWGAEGTTGVAYKLDPYGVGTTPTATKPHFTGTLTVPGGQNRIGGSADEVFTGEARFKLNGKPTKLPA